MNDMQQRYDIWGLVVPAAGFVALCFLVLVALSLVAGVVGILSWLALRLLPIVLLGALVYWIAKETGWWDRWFRPS